MILNDGVEQNLFVSFANIVGYLLLNEENQAAFLEYLTPVVMKIGVA